LHRISLPYGAINSFLLNKYWTFGQRRRTTRAEAARFALVTMCGIAWSSLILWFASRALHLLLFNATIWANTSKLVAIGGTALISYLGMRLWVFASQQPEKMKPIPTAHTERYEHTPASSHSLSVVLPAYNEEQIIAYTISTLLETLGARGLDFEIIVVNDGSTDGTESIVAALVEANPRVRLSLIPPIRGTGQRW
jgi:hypothetical protein